MAKAGLLFAGTDDGLVLFSNPNNIGRWLRIGQPFRTYSVRAVWPIADNPLVVFAAVAGQGLQRSDDGGQSWSTALEFEVASIVGARAAPSTLYLGAADGAIYRSGDGGGSWVRCAAPGAPAHPAAPLSVASQDAQALSLGLGDGAVVTSHDGGRTWAPAGRLNAPVNALAEWPVAPGMLVATAAGALYQGGTDHSWRALGLAEPAAGPLVALAGHQPALLAALAAGGIARSDDGGTTWARAALPETSETTETIGVIVPASYHIDTAFAGGAAGRLLSTSDRGRIWQAVKQDLPPIRSIAAARLV